ncbi:MAG: alpha-amylase [Ignavibacteriae bacterium]|nr:MAG: alpha-amylase [Ignavibacteriota bacterium]
MNNNFTATNPTFEFHVARQIREKYDLDKSFFSISGNVIFANFYQVRLFTQKVNDKRNVKNHVSPGELNGAGLIHEIYHLAISNYVRKLFPNAFRSALEKLNIQIGDNNFDNLLLEFIKTFPPKKVFNKELSVKQYLKDSTNSIPNKEILIEELILLYIDNQNPAFKKIKEFFDENYLQDKKTYKTAITSLKNFFKQDELKIGINNSDLFDFLSSPFKNHSDSIWDQLEFIKNQWGVFIDESFLRKIKSSKDLFIESMKFDPGFGGGGTPTIVPKYKGQNINASHLVIGKSGYKYAEDSVADYEAYKHFTPDVNWMPNLVLMAKNIYVWLDQLSKKYQRHIKTLDQIPIEELELLKARNINGLWLIGVWERSNASKRIKHIMGNIDAVASAYSLYDYQIANDLGGEHAYNVFNENAKKAGIRLASDMVPNHTGVYSKWMLEHPDYFIQLDYSPFPSYSFTGENLSEHPDFEIRIEDGYFRQDDAAVVFQKIDKRNGEVKYIYHGNDGTDMPWNDTAQLNLLKHEVREALIQKIFEVARKFSVIRFDAAMTLAKKHFARLWYPQPGKGGDIPSRADHALTRQQFDELFPKEFWREVVDRINQEMPETLLLAEAFWLMEGYFVRTLGMHRVYNSAFMNMMKNEENGKYRELITNTLEFEPEILKRYVNFMSNPDEETAIQQFGTDDKYFGVLVLMITLPGLPMFAHGQIEGYTEKYGMEYKRAYYDEHPNQWLVDRHEKEIFPILQKRYIFSEVHKYWIYDFIADNNVNQNVFVYSNEHNGEKGLVIYNNSFNPTLGFFNFSRQKLSDNSSGENNLSNTKISDSLEIKNSDFHFYLLRDVTTGLEYLYNGTELCNNGMFLNLNGYEYRVILYFEELYDPTGETYKFYKENFGQGRYNVKREIELRKHSQTHRNFEELFSEDNLGLYFDLLTANRKNKKKEEELTEVLQNSFEKLLNVISEKRVIDKSTKTLAESFTDSLLKELSFLRNNKAEIKREKVKNKKLISFIDDKNKEKWVLILIVKTILTLNDIFCKKENEDYFIADLLLEYPIKNILSRYSNNDVNINFLIRLINPLISFEEKLEKQKKIPNEFLRLRSAEKLFTNIKIHNKTFIHNFLNDSNISAFLALNSYEDKIYFRQESFYNLTEFFGLYYLLNYRKVLDKNIKTENSKIKESVRMIKKLSLVENYLKKEADNSGYIYSNLLENIGIKIKST